MASGKGKGRASTYFAKVAYAILFCWTSPKIFEEKKSLRKTQVDEISALGSLVRFVFNQKSVLVFGPQLRAERVSSFSKPATEAENQ